MYVHTDLDASRGRLAVADPHKPTPGDWRDVIPEDDIAVLEDYAILDGDGLDSPLLAVLHTRHAISELALHDLASGRRQSTVELPGLGTVAGISERPEGGHEAWLGYTDHATVSRITTTSLPRPRNSVPTGGARRRPFRSVGDRMADCSWVPS